VSEETTTTINGLRNSIKYVDEQAAIAGTHSQKALKAYEDLTGMRPNQGVDALGVYRIVCDILEKHQLIGGSIE
jgi:hypothetical protein